MGRSEIENILENNPDKWFSYGELANMIGISYGSVSRCCKRLVGFTLSARWDGTGKTFVKAKVGGAEYNSTTCANSTTHNSNYATKPQEAKT